MVACSLKQRKRVSFDDLAEVVDLAESFGAKMRVAQAELPKGLPVRQQLPSVFRCSSAPAGPATRRPIHAAQLERPSSIDCVRDVCSRDVATQGALKLSLSRQRQRQHLPHLFQQQPRFVAVASRARPFC
mmetsp:Transcript_69249/g.136886  ORF Transcript_69249/g.136886 Transcript_69249/m.136886 type:complete len:130 (+) Transcript_69249:111-500(+)